MKHLIPTQFILSVVGLFLLSSCASYQYVTLDSSQLSKNDRQEFSWENDTIKVVYNFNGQDGPVHLTLLNKTSQPMFVNWKKSAIIASQHSYSLYNSTIQASGEFSGLAYGKSTHMVSGGFVGHMDVPEGMDFIPPGSNIDKVAPVSVGILHWMAPIPDSVQSIKIADEYGNPVGKIRREKFDEIGSPFQFHSYITFDVGTNGASEFTVSHSFFVCEIVQTSLNPTGFVEYGPKGDLLYTKH